MNLVIVSHLVKPPSEGLMFRHLTMEAKYTLSYEVTIESPKDLVDNYYHFLKKRGLFDFVDDIILPEWRIEGVRIDSELDYPRTVKADYIRCENVLNLMGQIATLRTI